MYQSISSLEDDLEIISFIVVQGIWFAGGELISSALKNLANWDILISCG